MTDQTVLPANIQVSRSSKALDAQALQVANAPKTYDVQRAAIPVAKAMDPDYKNNSNIKWNFTKFLVDRNGNVIERFEPTIKPEKIEKKIVELL